MNGFPLSDPYEVGMLDVGSGHRLHWEVSGNPDGKPAVVLHGGPGTGLSPGFRRWFDPALYKVVLYDQRNCGQSTPHASEPEVDLSSNTTAALIDDCERIRSHLGIDRWLVWGGSWGTTLGLAYAEAHPERVTEMILVSIVTTTRHEVEWVTRAMGRVFPRGVGRASAPSSPRPIATATCQRPTAACCTTTTQRSVSGRHRRGAPGRTPMSPRTPGTNRIRASRILGTACASPGS